MGVWHDSQTHVLVGLSAAGHWAGRWPLFPQFQQGRACSEGLFLHGDAGSDPEAGLCLPSEVPGPRPLERAALMEKTRSGPAEPLRNFSAVSRLMRPTSKACSPRGGRRRRTTPCQANLGGCAAIPGARRSTPLLEGVVSPQRLRTKSSSKTAVAQCHPASSLFGQPLPLGGSLAQTPLSQNGYGFSCVCCLCVVVCSCVLLFVVCCLLLLFVG